MVLSEPVLSLLSQFPGPITLYPSRRRWYATFAISIAIILISVAMIARGNSQGWIGVALCGFIGGLSAIMLTARFSALQLGAEDFVLRHLFRSRTVRWIDAHRFEAVIAYGAAASLLPENWRKIVGYDLLPKRQRRFPALETLLSPHDCAMPDAYGLTPDDLADLMNAWRARAIGPA
jgi:hypothetical protein